MSKAFGSIFASSGLVMWGCNTGENEEFVFAHGSLCSKGSSQHAARCLTIRDTPPSGGGDTSGKLQLWAKPQPLGATAVLVINDMALGTANASVTLNLTEIRHSHLQSSRVLDIWDDTVVATIPAGQTIFTAPKTIAPHDSMFYLFEPAK